MLGVALALTSLYFPSAHGQAFSADSVKAAFLHRFASYVEWPPEALGEGPFVIAVAGAEGVARNLDQLLPQMTLQGRRAEVRRITRDADLQRVHILYVGTEALARTRELRAAAMDRPILVVTDDARGANGGVITFIEVNSRVRFAVTLPAAERAGLRIDSALLAVAERVEPMP